VSLSPPWSSISLGQISRAERWERNIKVVAAVDWQAPAIKPPSAWSIYNNQHCEPASPLANYRDARPIVNVFCEASSCREGRYPISCFIEQDEEEALAGG
jgi:hypothetical protein